jgi:YidC/Oxa1 family membrane protein insertase
MLVLANILQPLIDVFEEVLKFFHDDVGLSWGSSIIALTITIRALLLPLTLKQVTSMRALQQIAPQMKEVQNKYKDDKQRQQQEMMKLYQEHKVNPFASCLPLAAQIPVFISLFYMLRKDLRHDICPAINPPEVTNPKPCGSTSASQFFFIPDITDTATGGVLIALLVMYVGSQLLSSIFMSTTADRNQRLIMMGLPFFFVPFIIGFPAGLLVYWITTNLWTVGQGLVVRKLAPPPRPAAASGGGATPAGTRAAAPTPSPRRRRPDDHEEDGASAEVPERRASAPPPPPRKKKKRSGRRR